MTNLEMPWLTLTLAQEQPSAGGSDVPGMPGSSGAAPVPAGGTQSPAGGNPMSFLWIVMGGMLLLFLLTGTSGRKEKRRRAELLANLKKHDKVQTMAGIIGVVVEIRGDEVILRVDEGTNTRIRFQKGAIQSILSPASQPNGSVEAKPATEGATA